MRNSLFRLLLFSVRLFGFQFICERTPCALKRAIFCFFHFVNYNGSLVVGSILIRRKPSRCACVCVLVIDWFGYVLSIIFALARKKHIFPWRRWFSFNLREIIKYIIDRKREKPIYFFFRWYILLFILRFYRFAKFF